MSESYYQLYNAIDTLERLCRLNRLTKHESKSKSMHESHYAMEYKTVHVNVGRGVGKTTYVIDKAIEKHFHKVNTLVIVPHNQSKNYVQEQIQKRLNLKIQNSKYVDIICSYEAEISDFIRQSGKRYEYIYVDEEFFVNMNSLYARTATDSISQQYIVLG